MITYQGREFATAFDVQIHILFQVLGATHPARDLTNAFLARAMNISDTGMTRRRNGEIALHPGEPSAIVRAYRLNDFGLDFQLFDITDPDQFLEQLKNKGVGVYEMTPRRRLSAFLAYYDMSDGFSIQMRRAQRNRGVNYGLNAAPPAQVFHVGERIELVIRGKPGRHVAVVQVALAIDHVLDVVAPTDTLPLTELIDATLLLPNRGDIHLVIERPADKYALIAIEGPASLIELFGADALSALDDGFDAPRRVSVRPMSDNCAASILEAIDQGEVESLRVARTEFIVD